MKKNIFELPLIELILLQEADIIATSNGVSGGGGLEVETGDDSLPGGGVSKPNYPWLS